MALHGRVIRQQPQVHKKKHGEGTSVRHREDWCSNDDGFQTENRASSSVG